MMRPDPLDAALMLVRDRHPGALQAWLGGSAASGRTTATSDLDITVLLSETEVHRASATYAGWPVELFVHTDTSVRYFVEKDRLVRRPTMARLVAHGVPLLPGAAGADLRSWCAAVLEEGPAPLSETELQLARYMLTDLLDDLAGGGQPELIAAVAVEAWRRAAELHLAAHGRWLGSGKWLMRELEALDAEAGTRYAERFHEALAAAVLHAPGQLVALADDVLAHVGGRLRDGLHLPAVLPNETPGS